MKRNTLSQVYTIGIYVRGDQNQVASNKVTNTALINPFSGIRVLAAGTGKNVVTGNVLENIGNGAPDSAGIYVSDPEPTVQANKLTWAGRIEVLCPGCNGGKVTLNSVLGSQGSGFIINSSPLASPAARLLVQGNKAAATRGIGFDIQGPPGLSQGKGIVVQRNAASETAFPAHAFRAAGSGHTFDSNTALNSGGAGFYAQGDNLLFQSNLATKSTSSGFVVDAHFGATLYANRAVTSVGQGFALYNNPSGTTGALNTGSLNRQDFCNEGPATNIGTFATTSTTCDIRQ